jgi:hypothetical protein
MEGFGPPFTLFLALETLRETPNHQVAMDTVRCEQMPLSSREQLR